MIHLPLLICTVMVLMGVANSDTEKSTNCVSNYFQLEQGLKNDTDLLFRLHQLFYPPNSHPPYSIEVVYQTHDANGSFTRVSTDPDCKEQLWLWLSSPIFIFIKPKHLTLLSLYTLNFFRKWTPKRVNITIAEPCKQVENVFLEQLTAQLRSLTWPGKSESVIKNTLKSCELPWSSTFIPANSDLEMVVQIWNFASGIVLCIFLPAITSILLKVAAKDLLEKSYTYSYQHYGILWGVIVSSFLLAPLAIFHGIIVIHRTYAVNYIFLVLIVISGMPISIHFAAKHSLFATPRLFLWPAQLLCCFNKQRKQWLVSVTVVYITMTMFTYFCGMVIVMMFAMFAEPYPVILNSLILVLVLFCLINIFAILFTTSAHIFTPRSRRPHGNPANILNAVVLILILVIVAFSGTSVGLASAAVNGESSPNTMKSILTTVALPLLLGMITLVLKRLIWKWMNWSDVQRILHPEDKSQSELSPSPKEYFEMDEMSV